MAPVAIMRRRARPSSAASGALIWGLTGRQDSESEWMRTEPLGGGVEWLARIWLMVDLSALSTVTSQMKAPFSSLARTRSSSHLEYLRSQGRMEARSERPRREWESLLMGRWRIWEAGISWGTRLPPITSPRPPSWFCPLRGPSGGTPSEPPAGGCAPGPPYAQGGE